MNSQNFPALDAGVIGPTRDALHAYSQVLGSWLEACRPRRKHWWHISLRPTVRGLTTGLVRAGGIDFELELDLHRGALRGQVAGGGELLVPLQGQPAAELAAAVREFLLAAGIPADIVPASPEAGDATSNYSADVAATIGRAWAAVAVTLASLRASIPEETSPIQVWPHHFDLAMVWLPGEKIPGEDPADEGHSDKQMNFGFTLGDPVIPEPYFYVTAYPLPPAFQRLELPAGTTWQTEGFSGAVLRYSHLANEAQPESYLLGLWQGLVAAGRDHLLDRPAAT